MKTPEEYIRQLKKSPDETEFDELIGIISEYYEYYPCAFSNGCGDETVYNPAGENEGSCRIFSFAMLHRLDENQTLNCFGEYYRRDVLQYPEKTDHANIRQFVKHGWSGIRFEGTALKPRT